MRRMYWTYAVAVVLGCVLGWLFFGRHRSASGPTDAGGAVQQQEARDAVGAAEVAETPIAWSITDLDAYFKAAGPAGETDLQTKQRLREWREEWDRDFRGKLVEWMGEVRDVRTDGTLVLRCNPTVFSDDTRVKLGWNAMSAAPELRRGQKVWFRARLEDYGVTGYELTDGEVLLVSQ